MYIVFSVDEITFELHAGFLSSCWYMSKINL